MRRTVTYIILILFFFSLFNSVSAEDYDFYYASSFKVNDNFQWNIGTKYYILENGVQTNSTSVSNISLTLTKSIAGVHATPITFYSDYVKGENNSTELGAVGNYFWYGWNSSVGYQFPLIYPAYRLNGTNYLDRVSRDPTFIATGYGVSYYGVFVTFTYNIEYQDFLNQTFYGNGSYTYETHTGLMIKSLQQSVLKGDNYISSTNITTNISSVPEGVITEYRTPSTQNEQNSNLKSVPYDRFGFIDTILPVVLLVVILKYKGRIIG